SRSTSRRPSSRRPPATAPGPTARAPPRRRSWTRRSSMTSARRQARRPAGAPSEEPRPAGAPAEEREHPAAGGEEGDAARAAPGERQDAGPAARAGDKPQAPGDGDSVAAVEADLDALLEDVKRERDEYLELAKRARADFENFRKRATRDAADAERRGREQMAREIVPVLDNLERALEAAAEDDPLRKGVELVHAEEVAVPGLVLETVSKGYRLDGRVIRAARVIVSE